jgi:hypothetical protein
MMFATSSTNVRNEFVLLIDEEWFGMKGCCFSLMLLCVNAVLEFEEN